MPDALSMLMNDPAIKRGLPTTEEGKINKVFAFTGFLAEMSPSFKDRVIVT